MRPVNTDVLQTTSDPELDDPAAGTAMTSVTLLDGRFIAGGYSDDPELDARRGPPCARTTGSNGGQTIPVWLTQP
jgi:hypothetical protein